MTLDRLASFCQFPRPKQVVKMRKAGIDTFIPLASKRCNTKRIGVTGVFTPPVTG